MNCLPVSIAGCLAICAVTSAESTQHKLNQDKMNMPRSYSLEINHDGSPGRGYFPIGMRPGMPQLTVHCGFNLWQTMTNNSDYKNHKPFMPLTEKEQNEVLPYDHFGYNQVRALTSLVRGYPKIPCNIPGYGKFSPVIDEKGKSVSWRSKHAVNYFCDAAWKYCLSYMGGVGEVIGASEAVGQPTLFWGMDNEQEGILNYAPEAKTAYSKWLKEVFRNNIAELNKLWGTSYPDFSAIAKSRPPVPDEYGTRPAEFLLWHQFQSENFNKFLAAMGTRLNEKDPYHRPVVFKSTQQTIEMPYTHRRKLFDHDMFSQLIGKAGGRMRGVNAYGAGDRQAYETNYVFNIARPVSGKQLGYGVMNPETNNHSGPGFQWAATFWRVLPNGLKAVNFFCTGYAGAQKDYSSFGHIGSDGKPRSKMFYAARWAHMVHRTERLWTEASPAPGVPKIAMLLPTRDVLLSNRTTRRKSKWGYPADHRVMIYGWLREAGYWIDVIPYSKLKPEFLKKYQALLLTDAGHLTTAEVDAITDYTKNGGVVVADKRPGYYDELHRSGKSLEKLFGVKFGKIVLSAEYTLPGILPDVVVNGKVDIIPITAKVLVNDKSGHPLVTVNHFGKGQAIELGFVLGDLRDDPNKKVEVSTFTSQEETADTGDDSAPQRTGGISQWLGQLLSSVGVKPAVRVESLSPEVKSIARIECPWIDSRGNMAFSVGVRGLRNSGETLPAFSVLMPLPGGPWKRAVIGMAEDGGLDMVNVKHLKGDLYRINFPPVKSAAMIYLMKNHPPLISIPQIVSGRQSIDGYTAIVYPEKSFKVKVELLNPSDVSAASGELRLSAVNNWKIAPESFKTPVLTPGSKVSFSFTVTPEPVSDALRLNWLYPLVVKWASGNKDLAIAGANVEVGREKQ